MKEVTDTSEEDLARAALESKHIDDGQKKRIRRLMHKGAFRRSETVVDEGVAKEIDEYHEKSIAAARISGELPDPKTDAFMQKRDQKSKGKIQAENMIRPTADRVLILPYKTQEETFGILIPDANKKKVTRGIVAAMGPTCKYTRLGAHVLFQEYGFETIVTGGHEYYLMHEENVLGEFDE